MARNATLLFAVLLPQVAAAGDHFFIYRPDAKLCPAVLDVGVIGETTLTVQVYSSPGASLQVAIDPNTLLASLDMVALAGSGPGDPVLGEAMTVAPLPSAAILRTRGGAAQWPPRERAFAAGFFFPVGRIGTGLTLLVGNPNGIDVSFDLSAPGTAPQRFVVPASGVAQVPLTVPNVSYTLMTVGAAGAEPQVIAALETPGKNCHEQILPLLP